VVVAQYVKPLRDSDRVIIEERFNQGQVQFINWRPGDDPYNPIFPLYDYHEDLPLRRSFDRPVTIVLEDKPELRALTPIYQTFYPNLTVDEIRDHYNPQRSVAFALRIPLADLNASWGWQPAGAGRWQTMLDVSQLQQYELTLPAEPAAQVWVDDAVAAGPVLLTAGLHPVRVEGTSVAPELWWNGQPVPRERLFTVANFSESWQLSSLRGAPARYQPLAWQQVLRFGGTGQQPGQFFRPIAIEVLQPSGDLLVADVENVRMQRFDANGAFKLEFGQRGTAPGELEHEFGTALDSQGRLYLADRWNDRVQAFTVDGDFVRVVVQAGAVRDVLVEPGGTLLVTVPGSQQVWRVTPEGQVLLTMGQGGMETGQLQEPIGVAQDTSGNIYVNDAGRKAVLKFSPSGQFLLEWPAPFVTWESYVAVSPDGNIYVSAPDENTVHAFTPDGVLLVQGTPESGYNPFDQPLNHPMGLTFDSAGNLYVTSTYSDEVVKFAPVALDAAQQ
jgi:sugar lactone lactonase YvrE